MVDLNDITLVSEPSRKQLNERQRVDYRAEREDCLQWLLAVGKTPKRGEGYARDTVKPRSARMDKFYRWVWTTDDGYTTQVTHSHADDYLYELAAADYSNVHKNNCLKALQMLFKWRSHKYGGDPWEPDIRFERGNSKPRDYFSDKERRKVKQQALEYGAIPHYKSLTAAERDEWKAHLAQRFEMPKEEVSKAEFERANGWKVPSLVWVSMDAGFRPIEVKRSRVQWVDLENDLLRIPKAESSKTRDNWGAALTTKSVEYLGRWLDEREQYAKYADSDAI